MDAAPLNEAADSADAAVTPMPRLLTLEQAAEHLDLPAATLRAWRVRRPGFGPRAIKLPASIRYTVEELDRWLDSMMEDLPEPEPYEPKRGKAPAANAHARMVRARRPRSA